MELIEQVQLTRGRCGSALATTDITEGRQGWAHDHQNCWAVREDTALLGSSSLLSHLSSPCNDTSVLAHWTFVSCMCFGYRVQRPKLERE